MIIFTLRNSQNQLVGGKLKVIDEADSFTMVLPALVSDGYYLLRADGMLGELTRSSLGVLEAANPDAEPDPYSRFGTVAHLKHLNNQERDKMLDLMQRAGLGWVREGFLWHELEPEPGQWQTDRYDDLVTRSLSYGINVLPVLCFGNDWAANTDEVLPKSTLIQYQPKAEPWQNYIRTMVERYGDRVDAWEIWNEPNHSTFWRPQSNAQDFAETAAQATEVIRELAPGDTIVSAGLSPCRADVPDQPERDEALFISALAAHDPLPFDAIGSHPYTLYRHGVTNARSQVLFDANLATVLEGMEGRVVDPASTPLWLTEMGVSTIPRITTEENAAGHLAVLMTLASIRSNAELMVIYNFRDVGNDPAEKEHMFGLLHHNYTPKPGYFAVRNFIKKVGQAAYVSSEESGGIVIHTFAKDDGGMVDIIWALEDSVDYLLSAQINSITDVTGSPIPIALTENELSIRVTPSPIYLEY